MVVATRYAKSLIDFALEKGQLEAVNSDMIMFKNVCDNNRDFIVFLNSPLVNTDKKVSVLNALFEKQVNKMTLAFFHLLAKKRRETYLPGIATAFLEQYRTHKKILTVVITSAAGLDDTTRKKALELVKSQAKGEIELIEKVDKSIIGGFVLNIGDKQIDKSVSRQLLNLKKNFSENVFVSKL